MILVEKSVDRTKFMVRLQMDVKSWLEREATRNGASQNSEIVRSLRARMESQERAQRAFG
jgi:predicted HicB family RNase H-like nuclease